MNDGRRWGFQCVDCTFRGAFLTVSAARTVAQSHADAAGHVVELWDEAGDGRSTYERLEPGEE